MAEEEKSNNRKKRKIIIKILILIIIIFLLLTSCTVINHFGRIGKINKEDEIDNPIKAFSTGIWLDCLDCILL